MGSLFDPGASDRRRSRKDAKAGKFTGGSFGGPGSLSGDFSFEDNKLDFNTDLGDFQGLFDQLRGFAGGSFDQMGQLPPGLLTAAQDAQAGLVPGNTNQDQLFGLGDIFASSAEIAQADPFDLGAGISEKLRALSERRNQRLVNTTFDRLKASGKLGTTGGAGIAAELDQNLFDQSLQFDLTGLQAGQGIQRDAFGRALSASQLSESIHGRNFGENFQNVMSTFGIDQQMFDNLQRSDQQLFGQGMSATAGAQGLAQMPLAFMQAMLGAGTTASNSFFQAAGINQQNAANRGSPFLDALGAAGGFATGLGDLNASFG